jgi:hypothetical protein
LNAVQTEEKWEQVEETSGPERALSTAKGRRDEIPGWEVFPVLAAHDADAPVVGPLLGKAEMSGGD